MNDQEIIVAVKHSFATVRMGTPAVAVIDRGDSLRRRHRRSIVTLGGTAVIATAALVVAGLAPGSARTTSHPGTQASATRPGTTLAAWSVTQRPDGIVQVTIREMQDIPGLQAELRSDGVPAVVTASLAIPGGCVNWRDGAYRMGDVLTAATRSGAPDANGTELLIRPAEVPDGALLWLGLAQTGAPAGSSGPAGPVASAYLADTPDCLTGEPTSSPEGADPFA